MSDQRIADILEDCPSNWNRWGEDDELGAVNYLTSERVLAGVQAVEDGETFTLGLPIGHEDGEPVAPDRSGADHYMALDKGHYESGKFEVERGGGIEYADDVLHMFTQGTTHFDALGHLWYDGELYNGFDAGSTKGGLEHCDVTPIAEHGVVGRGILLDVARHRDVDRLSAGDRITLDELQACADEQGTTLQSRDILLIRTGWVETFYEEGREAFYEGSFNEPGLTYTPELVEWFHENEIPAFATDTLANEQSYSEETETMLPLHAALLCKMGVSFNELVKLDDLAAHCAETGKYTFLYAAAPLGIEGGTAGQANPIVIT